MQVKKVEGNTLKGFPVVNLSYNTLFFWWKVSIYLSKHWTKMASGTSSYKETSRDSDPQVLSVIAQQILQIQNAIKASGSVEKMV